MKHAAKLALAPSVLAALIFVYGFIAWTIGISFTASTIVPRFEWVGFDQYLRLLDSPRWETAASNLVVFAVLFMGITISLGFFLAALLDQKIRGEGVWRAIYLYPMAISFIVTGTAWKWILDPGVGIEAIVRSFSPGFTFDWIVDPDKAIYTVVIAAIWQSSGFAMALFLAGLRSVDQNLVRAAVLDGAGTLAIYRRIIIPALRPIFFSVLVVLSNASLKTFDLVVALTGGGPGYATDLPATFMYAHAFQRSQLGLAAASAVVMLAVLLVLLVPYLRSELRKDRHA